MTMRLVAAIALATSTIVFGGLAACSSFDDARSEDDAGANDAGANDGPPSSEASAVDGDAPDDAGTFCSRTTGVRVCDDFEDGYLFNAPWQGEPGTQVLPASALASVSDNGNTFLRVTVPPSTSDQAVFLRHDFGTLMKSEITFALTFRIVGFGSNDYVEIANLYLPDTAGQGIAYASGDLKLFYSNGPASVISGSNAPGVPRRIIVKIGATGMKAYDVNEKLIGELAADAGTGVVSGLRFGVGLYFSTPSNPPQGAAGGVIEIDDVVLDY